MTAILAAAVDNWVGLGLSVALLVFLTVALIFPERF
jgi:K+-transporting ATPase KdpF subunit